MLRMTWALPLVMVLLVACGDSWEVPTPVPTAMQEMSEEYNVSQFVWSDRYVKFITEPTVCSGVLTLRGETVGGAVMGDAAKGLSEFSIYRLADTKRARRGFGRVVDPILSFLRRPPPGQSYGALPSNYRVASELIASGESPTFYLRSTVPRRIKESPDQYVLGIWGFRSPTGEYETIRSIALKSC